MNQEIIERLSVITEEEKEILAGRQEIDQSIYTVDARLIVDSKKMLDAGKLIQIRPHTRFVHFPKHKHNYVEVIYMCKGKTVHRIDEKEIILKEGELLFLNQDAEQEIFPAEEGDLAINFIILPEFFDVAFKMLGEEENLLRDFLVGCLCTDHKYDNYLHFHVADVLPVQNLVENMVWTILKDQPNDRILNQTTMGLLFMQLTNYTDKLETADRSFEENLLLQVLRFIDGNYRDGQLGQLCEESGYNVYWLSRMIKKLTGRNYKELVQIKRLNQASYLLLNTRASIADISMAVGYDNTSYFHRIFRDYYGTSPKEYRKDNKNIG
ncbi:MAG: AraC family transcriptional regulator [Lachnospiraceae bacterium]|nr:AraC family transcriptional regulator [Lachnospiraceae bacterium]